MTIRKAVIYSTLLVAAICLWCYTHSDRAKVMRVFVAIEKTVVKTPGETMMEGAGKSQALARRFKDGCAIIALGHGLEASYTRENIAGGLLVFRSAATRIDVVFRDLSIKFDNGIARVEGWIDHSGTDASWPRYEPRAEKFLAHLEKVDGEWLISRIKVP